MTQQLISVRINTDSLQEELHDLRVKRMEMLLSPLHEDKRWRKMTAEILLEKLAEHTGKVGKDRRYFYSKDFVDFLEHLYAAAGGDKSELHNIDVRRDRVRNAIKSVDDMHHAMDRLNQGAN